MPSRHPLISDGPPPASIRVSWAGSPLPRLPPSGVRRASALLLSRAGTCPHDRVTEMLSIATRQASIHASPGWTCSTTRSMPAFPHAWPDQYPGQVAFSVGRPNTSTPDRIVAINGRSACNAPRPDRCHGCKAGILGPSLLEYGKTTCRRSVPGVAAVLHYW